MLSKHNPPAASVCDLKSTNGPTATTGQQRGKLEIAIAPRLEELDRTLEKAQRLSRSVLDEDAEFRATAKVLQDIATATQELSADGLNYVAESTRATIVDKQVETTVAEKESDENSADAEKTRCRFDPMQAVEQISSDAQLLYERFTKLEVLLRQIGSRQDRVDVAFFASNRLVETRRLIEQTSAWIRQLKQQQAGNYHRSAEVAQYRLAIETDSMAGKLADFEQRLAGLLQNEDGMLPTVIAEKARSLLATLDELLRELEQEIPIEEVLGIPQRPSNLQIMSDWLRSGGDNALMTGGNGRRMISQMRQQQQMRQRQLDKAYRRAVARALKESEAEDLVKNVPMLARETGDWNRLASQLEDDLRQRADKSPPERYRRAIEQYFRQVSGSEKESE